MIWFAIFKRLLWQLGGEKKHSKRARKEAESPISGKGGGSRQEAPRSDGGE
jgi:hypothetical protein